MYNFNSNAKNQFNMASASNVEIQKLQKNDSDVNYLNSLNLCIENNKPRLEIYSHLYRLGMTKGLNKRINSEMLNSPNTSKIQKLDHIPNASEQKNPISLNENNRNVSQTNDKQNMNITIDDKTKNRMDSFDVFFLLTKFFQKSKGIEYTSLPFYFDKISQKRKLAIFNYYKKSLMMNEKTFEICFNQNKESKISFKNPKKDTNDKIQNIDQNIMQPIDVINDLKDCGLFYNNNDNFTNYAINDCLSSLNCDNACNNDKIVKIDCKLLSNGKDSEFSNGKIFYKTYKFILDYENQIMKKISSAFNSKLQVKFEFENEIETGYFIRKVNLHLPKPSKKSKRKQSLTQNEYRSKAIFFTLNYNGIDYIRNDFFISKIEPLETFFELNFFDNLQYTDYVKSILNIDAFVDDNFNTKSSFFFTNNCLDFIKLVIFSDKYLSNGIENSAANWEMVYDKICSVFEAKNIGIKYVFQELLFFKSYYFKEKFDVIETKRTFSIGQVLFFLCIFEKIMQFDWLNKIAQLKLVLFNNKIDNINISAVTESIENVKLKVQSLILAYTTTCRILSILLHPFLVPIDYIGYLNIILILLYRYKSAYLGNKSTKPTLKGYVLNLQNINFYKNIMFTMPCNLKNINIDNYINVCQKNFQFKECQDFSDDMFALFSILNFFYNQTVNHSKKISYITDKKNIYELFQVVTYYYLFFQKLIEIEVIKNNSELIFFDITFFEFFIDLESNNYGLHEEMIVNLKKLFEMTLNLQKFYDYFSN